MVNFYLFLSIINEMNNKNYEKIWSGSDHFTEIQKANDYFEFLYLQ